jgi:hypothetical protein
MADSGIVITYEISKILDERASLRQELDNARNQFTELEKLVSQGTSSIPAQIPAELTSTKTPPAEIAAALQYFQLELTRINKAQEAIRGYQAEINEIETKQRVIVVVVGVIIAIVLLAIAFGGMDLITSVMSNISR